MEYQVHTIKDRPDLSPDLQALNRKSWPDFIIYGDTCRWDRLYAELGEFLILLMDRNDVLMGGGFTVPVTWNGEPGSLPASIEAIIASGLEGEMSTANALIPIAAVVDKKYRSEGISTDILKQMKRLAIQHKFQHLIVPVRPTWKTRYPLQGIESYSKWRDEDGLYYDPWLRTHQRLGATVIKCVESTLKIEGTVEDWEKWTGMVFPESGAYVVPHALQPVVIDVERNLGVYDEPNVWMRHPLP